MEVRKLKIGPEDEARLRELLKIHESEIDAMTDEELDAAEKQNSEQLFRLVRKNKVVRFRIPVKSSAVAFLAAAAALLFVQVQRQPVVPESKIVSKGTEQAITDFTCETSIVAEKKVADFVGNTYQVPVGVTSYLRMTCTKSPVFVHLGYMRDKMLHLEYSNLSISEGENLIVQGEIRMDVMAEKRKHQHLMVLVTGTMLSGVDLSAEDLKGLWLDDVPLEIK